MVHDSILVVGGMFSRLVMEVESELVLEAELELAWRLELVLEAELELAWRQV